MSRRYRLLCPIARALDRVGDRWTLLILRDLHAGPARFVDVQASLPGLAPNLLTKRLRQLEADGLICRRETELSVSVYQLICAPSLVVDQAFAPRRLTDALRKTLGQIVTVQRTAHYTCVII